MSPGGKSINPGRIPAEEIPQVPQVGQCFIPYPGIGPPPAVDLVGNRLKILRVGERYRLGFRHGFVREYNGGSIRINQDPFRAGIQVPDQSLVAGEYRGWQQGLGNAVFFLNTAGQTCRSRSLFF